MQDKTVASLKSDCSLFSHLFISCQTRNGNLDNFSAQESHAFPPSLSNNSVIQTNNKSGLLEALEAMATRKDTVPNVDAIIWDGAAVVQMLSPISCRTFSNYAVKVFLPNVGFRLLKSEHVDTVCHGYIPNSLKSSFRATCRIWNSPTNLPENWQSILRVDDNRTELFRCWVKQTSKILRKANNQHCRTDCSLLKGT